MLGTCTAVRIPRNVRYTYCSGYHQKMQKFSGSVFAYCKRSKTGAGEGLGTRLVERAFQQWLCVEQSCELCTDIRGRGGASNVH